MKKTIFTIFIVLVVLAIVFFLIRYLGKNVLSDLVNVPKVSQENVLPMKNDKLLNKKVPFFDLQGSDGARIKLSSFIDKPFVVFFWASHNVESANQLKILDEYISSLKEENNLVSTIFINSQEEENTVKSFLRRGGYDVLVALDQSGSATNSFNIKSLPTAFFVDRDGVVREVYAGVLSRTMFVDKIEQLLK